MMKIDEHAITVEGLTKRYADVLAVDDISFNVRGGEVFAFLGPNGAGKTTTVEIICGSRRPTAGVVRVLGMDVASRKSEIVRRIGVLPQGGSSFDRLTVQETIRYYARLFSIRDVDVDGLMRLTNLTDKRDVQYQNLSGGTQQRLGIVLALVHDPELVFLDEPTTGLDPHARRSVWEVLQRLREQGKTVFLTTHYMEEAESLADTVAIISNGRVIASGSPQSLIDASARDMRLTLASTDERIGEFVRAKGLVPIAHESGGSGGSGVSDNGDITLRVATTEDLLALLAAMKDASIALPRIDIRRPTLEEVYLDLTGEPLDDELPAARGVRP